MPTTSSPFQRITPTSLIAVRGPRNGYIQLASAELNTHYADMPSELLLAAKTWAAKLESLGAKRVYWIILSEQVQHLHIHLYPRWDDNETRGIALFEQRDSGPQPVWESHVQTALIDWANTHKVNTVDTLQPLPKSGGASSTAGMANPFIS